MTKNFAICVIHSTPSPNTETFIRAHIERLPGNVSEVVIWPPQYEGKLIGNSFLGLRYFARIREQIGLYRLETALLAHFLKHHQIDVVLAEYGPTGLQCLDACLKAGVKLVVHFHGYDVSVKSVISENLDGYRYLFSRSAALIAVSKPMVEKLIEIGADRRKIYLNPYGVETKEVSTVEPGKNAPIFVGVGRFVDKKAPFLTILAFDQVYKRHPQARLILAGDGPLLDACAILIEGLGLEKAVELPGRIGHAKVSRLLEQARAFVQHSVRAPDGDMEGTPVAILEAGARGLPVISTRHAGIPDAVIDGHTGLLVDEYDVERMADHMLKLSENAAYANELGKNAGHFIRQQYRMSQHICKLSEILESVA